ncbi:MAG: NADH-quinone oxidoreductase subunit C [Gammaproteobacteria bacterium]|nr:NADH-quinone oxidoreductase subunit C [Gammaproteobacteria bacterium]MBU6509592.1 NADH-quinone oxidoreductase subunit C [Gammaproteobacteria bacterium]MDE1984329.1 NADH-quinone oxidoreductase subunit C [Gammaproteobacteria bacterium]MDE2108622.1 NADH-quinone oxidoreductase subunit C [Gammaproteobacteria bacterium]MDE2461027.1 NADH-quinone oxidoreductase subunit C [Gammaproteobacteria bacterium]
MTQSRSQLSIQPLPGVASARYACADATGLHKICEQTRAAGGTLQALWASDERDRDGGFRLWIALGDAEGLLLLELPLAAERPEYPDLSDLFPAAAHLQRATHDLLGVRAVRGDSRPWLRHAAWPEGTFPLRRDLPAETSYPAANDAYPFVRVTGEGVHEIAVGPVHAGTIEPGHFRFSAVGEKVLRLEVRLGYAHKGIEKRFESLSVLEGQRLAARVCGDSAVAFSWAYCMALEGMCGTLLPERTLRLRALLLERERLANHLGDLGALGNDAGFAMGLTQFSRLKEELLRMNARVFGSRYPMDAVIPGGVAADLTEAARRELLEAVTPLENEITILRNIYADHSGLQDRFTGTGRITPALAAQLGLRGLAGRASGQPGDLRCDHPCAPYDKLAVRRVTQTGGDVAARVAVRFAEAQESLRLCRVILESLPSGEVQVPLRKPDDFLPGSGWIEGWRGPVLVFLQASKDGRIRRCHPHDPSWQNWPVVEHAIIGNIVADFPLINKSFNLSYSGVDL